MENTFFMDAVTNLASGKVSSCSENGTIVWKEDATNLPTDIEIQTEKDRLQAEYDANQYQRDRQYPSIGDQLDMLFHDMTADKGSKTGEWYKAIAKVKSDNPKE
jgi:hypothetical protein